MKNIGYYINNVINEGYIQGMDGKPKNILDDNNEVLNEFLILLKYADLFNSMEQQWHLVNKSTPVSRAIREETDKLFNIAYKVYSVYKMSASFDYKKEVVKDIMFYYEEDELKGKRLNTIIKRSDEWKVFYKSFKRFKNETIKDIDIDAQILILMNQFIKQTKEFVEDVQS